MLVNRSNPEFIPMELSYCLLQRNMSSIIIAQSAFEYMQKTSTVDGKGAGIIASPIGVDKPKF